MSSEHNSNIFLLANLMKINKLMRHFGDVAEWLRRGLQNPVHQFNSGRRLHHNEIRSSLVPLSYSLKAIRCKDHQAISKNRNQEKSY